MYIVHLGISGFPNSNAALQRVRFTFKAIKSAGYTPLIINKISIHSNVPYTKQINRYEDLIFISTAPYLVRSNSYIKRNIEKVRGILGEFKLLYYKRKQITAAILYTDDFKELFYYRLVSKFLKFKLIIQYVEYRSAIEGTHSKYDNFSFKLFDKYCHNYCDGVIVISDFLKNVIETKNSKLPIIKIPAICDFNDFTIVAAAQKEYNYFLYCGTLAYLPVINFILSFYQKIRDLNLYNGKLLLIVNGSAKEHAQFESDFKKYQYINDIVVYNRIPYDMLVSLYKSADLLLIPLRNNVQDIARFPHKVGEYTASGRPMLSSKIGELKHYFVDMESALLVDEYDVDLYVDKLKQMIENNISFDDIGKNGFKIGYNNFHYASNVNGLTKFLKQIAAS